jgi:hypothetical protein
MTILYSHMGICQGLWFFFFGMPFFHAPRGRMAYLGLSLDDDVQLYVSFFALQGEK